jgi:hypothetical protein
MALGDISFGATNLKSGADADKPNSPKAGDIYVATDTSIVYVCYVRGEWVDATPINPFVTNFEKFEYLRTFPASIQLYPVLSGSRSPTTTIQKVGGSITITDVNIPNKRISAKFGTYFNYSASGYNSVTYYRINGGQWVVGVRANISKSWNYATQTGWESKITTGDIIEIGVVNNGSFSSSNTVAGSMELLLTGVNETILIGNV